METGHLKYYGFNDTLLPFMERKFNGNEGKGLPMPDSIVQVCGVHKMKELLLQLLKGNVWSLGEVSLERVEAFLKEQVPVLDHRWRPPLCLMEAFSGQSGITVSSILHIIQVYLKNNTIRIIMTRMQKNSEPKCD